MPISIPTASSAQDLSKRLADFRGSHQFVAMPIDLKKVDEPGRALDPGNGNAKLWRVDERSGNVARNDGLFFQVRGLELRPKGAQDNSHYFQPIVQETPPAGTVVLVCDKQSGDILVEMRIEAGSDPQRKFTTFGPSLQVSSSRLELAKTNRADPALPMLGALVGLGALTARAIEVQQDSGRFLNKRNEFRVVFVEGKDQVDIEGSPSLLWTALGHLEDDMNVNEANEFLWQSLGLLAREQRKA